MDPSITLTLPLSRLVTQIKLVFELTAMPARTAHPAATERYIDVAQLLWRVLPVGVPPVGVWWLPHPAISIAKPTAAVIKPSVIKSLRRRSKSTKKVNRSAAADKVV